MGKELSIVGNYWVVSFLNTVAKTATPRFFEKVRVKDVELDPTQGESYIEVETEEVTGGEVLVSLSFHVIDLNIKFIIENYGEDKYKFRVDLRIPGVKSPVTVIRTRDIYHISKSTYDSLRCMLVNMKYDKEEQEYIFPIVADAISSNFLSAQWKTSLFTKHFSTFKSSDEVFNFVKSFISAFKLDNTNVSAFIDKVDPILLERMIEEMSNHDSVVVEQMKILRKLYWAYKMLRVKSNYLYNGAIKRVKDVMLDGKIIPERVTAKSLFSHIYTMMNLKSKKDKITYNVVYNMFVYIQHILDEMTIDMDLFKIVAQLDDEEKLEAVDDCIDVTVPWLPPSHSKFIAAFYEKYMWTNPDTNESDYCAYRFHTMVEDIIQTLKKRSADFSYYDSGGCKNALDAIESFLVKTKVDIQSFIVILAFLQTLYYMLTYKNSELPLYDTFLKNYLSLDGAIEEIKTKAGMSDDVFDYIEGSLYQITVINNFITTPLPYMGKVFPKTLSTEKMEPITPDYYPKIEHLLHALKSAK